MNNDPCVGLFVISSVSHLWVAVWFSNIVSLTVLKEQGGHWNRIPETSSTACFVLGVLYK